MIRAMAAKRPSLRPGLSVLLDVCVTNSEVETGLDAHNSRLDHSVVKHTAGAADPVWIAASRFEALHAAVDHAIAIEQVGGKQFEAQIVLLHADAQIGNGIGTERPLEFVFEVAKVAAPLADV